MGRIANTGDIASANAVHSSSTANTYLRNAPMGELCRVSLPHAIYLLERDYRKGIGSAFYKAIRYCHEHKYPLPDWIVERLDFEAAVALGEASPIKTQGSRDTDPRREKEKREKELVASALLACNRAGLKGKQAYLRAKELLEAVGVYRSVSTLEKPKLDGIYPTSGTYEPFRRMLGLSEDLYGYLMENDDDT